MDILVSLVSTVVTGIIYLMFPDVLQWLKWMISYLYAYFDKKLSSKRFDVYDFEALNQPEKVCFLIPEIERYLETPLEESLLHQNGDDIFCYGVNDKDECLLVRVSRRSSQKSQATVYLKMANGKTYSLVEDVSQYQQSSGDVNKAFTCGGLKIYYISPMRKWRIVFSGFLRECCHENASEEEVVHVKFSFLWRASSDVFDSLSDIPVSELARALSNAKWKSFTPPLKRLHKMLNFYCQAGVLFGTVKINGQSDENQMWLWGERLRLLGHVADMEGAEFLHILGYTTAGKVMHVGKISIPNVVEKELLRVNDDSESGS